MSPLLWALGAGGLAGLALVGAWRSAFPRPVALADALDAVGRVPPPAEPEPPAGLTGPWAARLGRALRGTAGSLGLDPVRLAPDLGVVGRPLEHHLGAKAVAAIVGFALPVLWVWAMAQMGVVALGPGLALTAGLGLGAAGWLLPDLLLRSEAAERRRAFVSAFSTYLDMVAVSLAGGVGVEGALADAARIGRGREAAVLRAALEEAGRSGRSHWDEMRALGAELGVDDLVEVAATVSLAGTEGARVRRSLEAKARSMRARELADAQAKAEAATERMAIPTALLMLGFLLLVGYPALMAVLGT